MRALRPAMTNPPGNRCLRCAHFRNAPAYLESVFKGLTALGSAHSSVRGDDGLCLLHDLYLSADACCESFERGERDSS
jgi:hypothetical protein